MDMYDTSDANLFQWFMNNGRLFCDRCFDVVEDSTGKLYLIHEAEIAPSGFKYVSCVRGRYVKDFSGRVRKEFWSLDYVS